MNSIEELPKRIKYLEGAINTLIALIPGDVDTDPVIEHMIAITDGLESDLLALWRQRELDYMADVDALHERIDELSDQIEKLKQKKIAEQDALERKKKEESK